MGKTNLRHVPRFAGPFWCFNGHAHTIGRSLIGDTTPPAVERTEMRYYIIEIMKQLLSKSYSVVAVNFRSCGFKMNNQPRFYHSGETDDFRTVFKWIEDNYPDQKIGAVGFSLGANALTKYLGEEKEHSPVDAAVAVSVPYNLRLCAIILPMDFAGFMTDILCGACEKNFKRNESVSLIFLIFSGTTIYEFDDQITAPIHDFKDADDYYTKCSAQRFVQKIKAHTLFVHSKEDPLCPIKAMPLAKMNNNQFTDYIITDEGGHVGFWSKPRGWIDFVIENYLSSNI